MTKYILRIRKVDKIVFDSIKNNKKLIETRAATGRYRKIKKGDILVFTCQGKKLEKQIKDIKYFKSIDQMLKQIDFKKIMPYIDSIDKVKEVYYTYYKEKIKESGLVAFWVK